MRGALNGFNVMLVDTNQEKPSTAAAANNLFRCLVIAGAVAIVTPTINRIGMAWMSVFIAGIWVVFSHCTWAVMKSGNNWRLQEKG